MTVLQLAQLQSQVWEYGKLCLTIYHDLPMTVTMIIHHHPRSPQKSPLHPVHLPTLVFLPSPPPMTMQLHSANTVSKSEISRTIPTLTSIPLPPCRTPSSSSWNTMTSYSSPRGRR